MNRGTEVLAVAAFGLIAWFVVVSPLLSQVTGALDSYKAAFTLAH